MSQTVVQLAEEVANARDIELPHKLLKIKDLLSSDENPIRLKHEIYKYNLFEALSVSFKNEYGYIRDGWNVAVELVKVFNLCTSDFMSTDDDYMNVLIPTASENVLVLAKKIQEKHIRSKGFSEEFHDLFRSVMKEYSRVIANNPTIAFKCIKSQRLFQLLLNDEQNTTSIVMNTYKEIIKIKPEALNKMDEKNFFILLDEVIYKMATSDLNEAGVAIFKLLVTMCKSDDNVIKLIIRKYKKIRLLAMKWKDKNIGSDYDEFMKIWEQADKTKLTDEEFFQKAVMIQKHWRGFVARKRYTKLTKSIVEIQKKVTDQKRHQEEQRQKKFEKEELEFQKLLRNRRKHRQRKIELIECLKTIPPKQIKDFYQNYYYRPATIIQAAYRAYRVRKVLKDKMPIMIKQRSAAVCIQRAVRIWLRSLKAIREQPAFYSRPPGLDGPRREFLFDQIRKHVESLPPHPRTFKQAQDLHSKAQRSFQDYVIGQRAMRQQLTKIQAQLAMSNNDANLILDCPKLSQLTEDDIKTFYTHRSRTIIQEAKEAHKKLLKKEKSEWYQKLNFDSDSEDEIYDDNFDELENNLRNMNFNSNTDNYYADFQKQPKRHSNIGQSTGFQLHKGISKLERDQLKTKNLRKAVMDKMKLDPFEMRIWNLDSFDLVDNGKK